MDSLPEKDTGQNLASKPQLCIDTQIDRNELNQDVRVSQ